MTARLHFRSKRHEPSTWIRQMVKHTNRECIIECAGQRQPVNICLNDMDVADLSRSRKSCFNRCTQVNSYNISSAPVSRQLRVTAFSATSLEHDLVSKKLWLDGCDTTEKLF